MSHIVLDASTLGIPDTDITPQSLDLYTASLLEIQELAVDDRFRLAISAFAADALEAANAYPLTSTRLEGTYPQRQDVLRVVTSLMNRLPHVEEVSGIRSLLHETEVRTDTKIGPLAEHRRELFALLALLQSEEDPSLYPIIVSSDFSASSTVEVVSTIHDIETLSKKPMKMSGEPVALSAIITVHGSAGAVACCERYANFLWAHEKTRRAAVELWIHRRRSTEGCPSWPIEPAPFTLGHDFNATVAKQRFEAAGTKLDSLARAIVDVALRRNVSKSHELRPKKGGGSGQIVRAKDGAKAWRHDVDYDYHLHYWSKGPEVELASIVVHNDFDIPA